jgi:hypothetical protein
MLFCNGLQTTDDFDQNIEPQNDEAIMAGRLWEFCCHLLAVFFLCGLCDLCG